MNLLSTTPANPLFPGWFVNCNWTWSPKHGYKFHFITWNSFHFQGFPVIFHSANLRDLVFTRGCFSPRSLSNMFGRAGKSNGHCMDILSRRVYQGCVCHFGVTSIIDIYHLTYQAELWECKTEHFVLVLLHSIYCKNIFGKLMPQPRDKHIYSWSS